MNPAELQTVLPRIAISGQESQEIQVLNDPVWIVAGSFINKYKNPINPIPRPISLLRVNSSWKTQ